MVKKQYTDSEIKEIIDENKRLKLENASMQKILQSKRFKFAEKVANTYNVVLPEQSKRRKIVSSMYAPVRNIKKNKALKNIRKIERLASRHEKIVVMHSIPWNTPLRQRPHHLAKCLADEGVMVIYLEPDEPIKNMRILGDNFVTINSWEMIFQLKLVEGKKYYFFFNNVSNITFELIEDIKNYGYGLVYEYIDEFHEDISGSLVNQLETWKKLPKLRPSLVLASADKLYNEAIQHFKKTKVILSKNAVVLSDFDYHNYENAETPNDLEEILAKKKPIVGYYGALAPWLDYGLISKSAKDNPHLNFVLIGVNYQNALKKLDQSINNIYYLGPKKYKDLPKYSSKFDCAIIPFRTGEIAKGTSPVKLFEYMAMGLPTVGTRDLKECYGYEYVYLAKNTEEFGEMLNVAISKHEDDAVKKQLLVQAEENTWSRRAKDIVAEL